MADLNKVFLMGRLTFDPELRRTPGGSAVTELRLATSRSWAGRDGERREETLFIDVTVWDRQAETCCQYLRKGSPVHVEGYLKMDTWEDKTTGEKRSKVKVQAERVQFLDSRRADGAGGTGDMSADDEMAPPARDPGMRRGRECRPDARAVRRLWRAARAGQWPGTPGLSARRTIRPAAPIDDEREEDDIPF